MKLKRCPKTPNCVCSEYANPQSFIEPLAFSETAEAIRVKIRNAILQLPRTTILEETDVYFKAESKTKWLRFIDDVEVFIDTEKKLIHFRSASRVGYSDLGVNRARILQLKKILQS